MGNPYATEARPAYEPTCEVAPTASGTAASTEKILAEAEALLDNLNQRVIGHTTPSQDCMDRPKGASLNSQLADNQSRAYRILDLAQRLSAGI